MSRKRRLFTAVAALLAVALVLLGGCGDDGGGDAPPKASPPAITTHPANHTVTEGQTATFSVTATGSGTLTYQWYRGGVAIASAQLSFYTTPPTTLTDDGAAFACMVSNADGSVTSNPATLTAGLDPADLTETYAIVDLTTGGLAQAASLPDLLTNDAYKTTNLVLKRIPAGSFNMGDEVGGHNAWELPVHTVNITQAFYLGVFEVTQRQWYEVEGNWPSNFTTTPDKRPVEEVSWNDIEGPSGFMDTLSSLTSMSLRLPTEAECEYACKAGTSTDYSYGSTEDGAWMWYGANSGRQTHEVGTTTNKPNPWGLYDMHGNVHEWCEDWSNDTYYQYCVDNSITSDPQGPASGSYRVLRGGSWHYDSRLCRSALRSYYHPSDRYYLIGFRVAVAVAGP